MPAEGLAAAVAAEKGRITNSKTWLEAAGGHHELTCEMEN